MLPSAVIAEGPDDLIVLRAMLRRAGGRCEGNARSGDQPMIVEINGSRLPVYAARGKERLLAQRALDAATGIATHRADWIVVCFDPDGDRAEQEFAFFRRDFESLRKGSVGALGEDLHFKNGDREVRIVPAPWRLDHPASVPGAPDDHQNLERVLLTGVLQALQNDPLEAWAREATTSLMQIVADHGWKRAFRVWNAALRPKTEHESFADGLLQEQRTKEPCHQALAATEAWRQIQSVITS